MIQIPSGCFSICEPIQASESDALVPGSVPLLVTNSEQTRPSRCRAETRCYGICVQLRIAPVLQGVAFSRRPLLCRIVEQERFQREMPRCSIATSSPNSHAIAN